MYLCVVHRSICYLGFDPDVSPDEQEEKARLIAQVLELQNTLDGEFNKLI